MQWKSSTKVILVRHGQSTSNASGRFQGRGDESVLTAKGRICAYQTGVALKDIIIDAIYTSPLLRARETLLEIMADTQQVPTLGIDSNLREINLPVWQGLPFEYVRKQFAEDYRCWKERPHEFQMQIPQFESLMPSGNLALATKTEKKCFPVLELYQQAQHFWEDILSRHVGETILVVSHNGTNRALISTAIGLKPEKFHHLQQSNCGISILNFLNGSTSRAQLEGLNLTTHLGETLPKLEEGKQGLRLLLVPSDGIDSAQLHRLAELLKPVSIDFSISSDLERSKVTAECILQHHPKTLQLQVLRQDFPQVWQRTIYSQLSLDTSKLTTSLVVASNSIIKSFLGEILGMKTAQLWRLELEPGAISVIHYPSRNSPPVLQAMNI